MQNLVTLQGNMKLQGELIIGDNPYSLDLTNWINRLIYYNLPLPSDTVIEAVKQLLLSLRLTGLRYKILRLNLFCAGDWIGSFLPLIIDIGNVWDYNGIHGSTVTDLSYGPFTASDWSLTRGFDAKNNVNYAINGDSAIGNTSNNNLKIIDTTVQQSNIVFGNNSIHMGCFISDINVTSPIIKNCTDIGGDATYFDLQCALNGNYDNSTGQSQSVRFNCYSQSITDTAGGTLDRNFTNYIPQGFYIGSRVSTTLNTIYKNGYYTNLPMDINGGFNPNRSTMVSTLPTSTSSIILYGKTNGTNEQPGGSRAINNVTDRTMSMYTMGLGLTDQDVVNYNNIIAKFNNAIGRTNY